MKNKQKRKILYFLLILFIILFISIIIIVIYNNKKIIIYDNTKIDKISSYLNIDSRFYDGIINDININYEGINFSAINDIYINQQLASYIVKNIPSNTSYDSSNCSKCYKYFSNDDDIRFYDPTSIDSIYNELFNKDLKRIDQDDKIGFNIIYYNEDIDMYYINVETISTNNKYISIFKDYSYDSDKLYLDYYYTKVEYDDELDKDTDDNNNIRLYNIDNILIYELNYDEFFSEDGLVINQDNYINYFDVIRYEFSYNYEDNIFILDKLIRIEK